MAAELESAARAAGRAAAPAGDDAARREREASARMALELTSLSNERTLLTYVRTALAFFAAGAALIRFFAEPAFVIAGWVFLPVGILLGIFGALRFRRTRQLLRAQWSPAASRREGTRAPGSSDGRG